MRELRFANRPDITASMKTTKHILETSQHANRHYKTEAQKPQKQNFSENFFVCIATFIKSTSEAVKNRKIGFLKICLLTLINTRPEAVKNKLPINRPITDRVSPVSFGLPSAIPSTHTFSIMFKTLLARLRAQLTIAALIVALPAAALALPFFGPKEQPFIFNFDFTINFFQPDVKWPVEKLLKPAEKEVYEKLGRPDAFRILYDSEGNIKIRQSLELEYKAKAPKTIPNYTWVYMQRNEEIVFSGNGYYTQPLTDPIRLILKYGDPENNKQLPDGLVEWTYYSTGKIYRIYQNKVISTKEFPPMGSFHK